MPAGISRCGPERPGRRRRVAEAFSRALERWAEVRSRPSPAAWVVRTATNLHIDQWRRSNRRLRAVRDTRETADERLDPLLVAGLLYLSQRQREVLALRVLLDLSPVRLSATVSRQNGEDSNVCPAS